MDSMLLNAAEKGDLVLVEKLVRGGADTETNNNNGWTPMIWAAFRGHLDVVKYLVENGANKDAKNADDSNVLMHAIWSGHLRVVQYLVEQGADMEAKAKDGETALIRSCESGRLGVVKYLVESGANKETKNNHGNTSLITAAKNGNLDVVRYLVDEGADVNAKDKYGRTALTRADLNGHHGVVQYMYLVEKDANKYAGLILAAWEGHLDKVRNLIEQGADKESKGYKNNTPLIVAAERGHLEVVKYLIDLGVDKESKSNNGNTALLMAAQNGHLGVVRYLVENGANSSCLNDDDNSALLLLITVHDANEDNILPIAKLLLENGTHALQSNKQGYSVKSMAKTKGYHHIDALVKEYAATAPVKENAAATLATEQAATPSWFISHDAVKRMDSEIGRGGFGMVYRATWAHSDVVVKEISVVEMRRFLKEVETWRNLTHNNVVPFYGANHRHEPYFIVSKYASNGTLVSYLKREKEQGRICVWQKLRDVAAGLSYLHEKKIVHGDLKGDNIVVSDNGTAMLTDFGLSFVESGSCYMKKLKDELGAMQWRAPELANLTLKTPTCSSDVYSLGMCIIEAVTGKIPWGAETNNQDLIRGLLRLDDVKAHLQKPGEMTDAQWELVSHMIEPDPEHRPDMDYVLSKLNEFAEVKIKEEEALEDVAADPLESWMDKLAGLMSRLVTPY